MDDKLWIPEVSGASCSTLRFGAGCADTPFLPQCCWDLWKKYFISLGDWLWSLLDIGEQKKVYFSQKCCFTVIPYSYCHSMSLLPSFSRCLCVILSISANTVLYPGPCIQLPNSRRKRGWPLLFCPAGPLSTSLWSCSHPCVPGPGRDNIGCLSKQQNAGSKCWSHSSLISQKRLSVLERKLSYSKLWAHKGHKLSLTALSPLSCHYPVHHQTLSLSTTSTHLSNSSRNGDSTTPLDSLFQWLTTLLVKKMFLVSDLKLPWQTWGLFLFSCCLLLGRRDCEVRLTSLQATFRLLQRAISFLFSRLNNPIPLAASHKTCALDPSWRMSSLPGLVCPLGRLPKESCQPGS